MFCGDALVAQEMAQEALIRAYRDWRKVRGLASPKAWVHTVGMNLARSHFRRRKIEHRVLEKVAAGTLTESSTTELEVMTTAS